MSREMRGRMFAAAVAIAMGLVPVDVQAQGQGAVSGAVLDPLGGRVPGATVTLVGERGQTTEVTNDGEGRYTFSSVAPGRYQVLATAPGFEPFTSAPVFVGAGDRTTVNLTLQLGAIEQSVVVTAAAGDVSLAQTGAPVTVLDSTVIEGLNKPDVLEALRLVPGTQVGQTGARGGTAGLFIRGGNSNFNKVLVDGIPVNDIGGAFDYAQLQVSGVERVEVLRQSNSVMYGSDALAGVVEISTRRGRTRIPEVEYALDGGGLGTISTGLSLAGAVKRFDYFSQYSHFDTDNQVPNNQYRNDTFVSRFGVAVGRGTDVSGSIRRTDTRYESPNGISLFGIADDSFQEKAQTYVSLAARSQWSSRWQSRVRVGWTDERFDFVNPAPSGTAFDPFGFGANYLGNVVTLRGPGNRTVTGRAILDFGGVYPSTFDSRTGRRLVVGDMTGQVAGWLSISGGARFEHERGYGDPDADPSVTRNNGGVFLEARAAAMSRAYISAGIGYERNAVFESAWSPRVSLAAYLRPPSNEPVGETKLTLNAGAGIKAPSVFQQENAVFSLVEGTPVASQIGPVGPERSRNFDVGIEQAFWRGNARARVSYFHNSFRDLLEFLGRTQLVQIGVAPEVAAATAFGGYANAASYRARGLEMSSEVAVNERVRFMGSYTYLDAEVTEALTATVATNPAFPGVRIGAFQALVGERPFGRPTHSGTLMLMYTQGRGQVTLAGHFVGARDYSTFLSDPFFGNSMLLPNQDLAEAYQKVDLSGAFHAHARVKLYATIENLFDQEYEHAFGFPSLPMTARVGFRVLLGGDR